MTDRLIWNKMGEADNENPYRSYLFSAIEIILAAAASLAVGRIYAIHQETPQYGYWIIASFIFGITVGILIGMMLTFDISGVSTRDTGYINRLSTMKNNLTLVVEKLSFPLILGVFVGMIVAQVQISYSMGDERHALIAVSGSYFVYIFISTLRRHGFSLFLREPFFIVDIVTVFGMYTALSYGLFLEYIDPWVFLLGMILFIAVYTKARQGLIEIAS